MDAATENERLREALGAISRLSDDVFLPERFRQLARAVARSALDGDINREEADKPRLAEIAEENERLREALRKIEACDDAGLSQHLARYALEAGGW